MRVGVYAPWWDDKHRKVLSAFARGIPGAEYLDLRETDHDADVGVIFGLVKHVFAASRLKKPVIERHAANGTLLLVESAYVGRGAYWRVGWYDPERPGGCDYRTDQGVSDDRWRGLVKLKVAKLWEWHKREWGPVVVCGQLARDTNVQDTDHYAWCRQTVAELGARGLDVAFRPHPREPDPTVYGIPYAMCDVQKIRYTLRCARAVVVYNSNSGVDAVLAGVPVVAHSPDAFCRPMASDSIERLRRPDRGQWLSALAYSQWNLEELESGEAWAHLSRGR